MRINKVQLIFPPYPIPKIFPKRVQLPLGIAYIAGVLRQDGYNVKVIDAIAEGWEKSEVIDSNYIQFGLSLPDLIKNINEYNPEVVGLSCMFGVQLKNVFELAKAIKQNKPDAFVIIGGAHASSVPREILEACRYVDYVILGEGERTLSDLLNLINHSGEKKIYGLDGIAFRDGLDNIIIREKKAYIDNIDELPYPARDLLPLEKYFQINRPHGSFSKHKRTTSILTSRGCPAKCVFCAIHSVWGRDFRAKSAEKVVDEIEHLMRHYNIREFQIEDDNMTFDAARAEKICDFIIERKLKISFTTPNGIAIWALNKKLLEKMKKAGFYRLTLAVESGNDHTLREIIRKPLNLKQVRYIVNQALRLGFILDTFYVFGFPGEGPNEINDTFRFARSLNVHSTKYFLATPYAGTDLYEAAKEKHMLIPGFDLNAAYVNPTKANINTEYFTAEQLEKIWVKENLVTQISLFLKRPISYTKDIFINYVKKNLFTYLRMSLKKA